jgi:hypothetical protein
MSKATVVQNTETKLEGISLEVVDKLVVELTTAIFDSVIKNEDWRNIVDDLVSHNVRKIAEKVLAGVGQEVNRGAIINCVAVAADAKSEDYDQIILRKSKTAGDITIPTQCILFSTNCVEVIQNSVIVDNKKDSKKSKKQGGANAA